MPKKASAAEERYRNRLYDWTYGPSYTRAGLDACNKFAKWRVQWLNALTTQTQMEKDHDQRTDRQDGCRGQGTD